MTLSVCYDLRTAPITYDFAGFLSFSDCMRQLTGDSDMHVTIRAEGFRRESPRDKSMTEAEKSSRIHGILVPLLGLCPSVSGFSVEYVSQYDYQVSRPIATPYTVSKVCDLAAKGADPQFMRAPDFVTVPDCDVVLSPRMSRHFKERNCELFAWHKFYRHLVAKGLEVIVIPDQDNWQAFAEFGWRLYWPAAWDITARIALFEKGFPVVSAMGPASILYYTKRPFLLFDNVKAVFSDQQWADLHGTEIGGQIPFLSENQRVTWSESTFDNLMAEYDRS